MSLWSPVRQEELRGEGPGVLSGRHQTGHRPIGQHHLRLQDRRGLVSEPDLGLGVRGSSELSLAGPRTGAWRGRVVAVVGRRLGQLVGCSRPACWSPACWSGIHATLSAFKGIRNSALLRSVSLDHFRLSVKEEQLYVMPSLLCYTLIVVPQLLFFQRWNRLESRPTLMLESADVWP